MFGQQNIQTFDVREFYKLGKHLSTPNNPKIDDESFYRTAIGRYYYYVFLTIRNIIVKYDLNNERYLKSPGAHQLLISYLNTLDNILKLNGQLQDIASTLGQLRNLRNDADYKTHNKKITYNDVIRAEGWAKDIINGLNNVRFGSYIGFEDILNYVKTHSGSGYVRFPRIKYDRNKKRHYFK